MSLTPAPIHNKSILLPILFTVLTVSLSLSTATARDTITPTQPLADNETLVSAGGTFALGFFTPNNSDDSRRYVGIWYYNITVQTIVWVANRASPISTRSTGQLSVTANGTITITNRETSTVVWYSVGSMTTNPVVQLLETGNFVVKEEEGGDNNNRQKYAWQSFDYPTDTLLPGMKLGVDKVAGRSTNLTAWKSKDDPSPGDYYVAMVIGNNNPEMYLFNRSSKKIWRSGPWYGDEFGFLRSWNPNNFAYGFVNNYIEVAFSFQVNAPTNSPLVLQLSPSGALQLSFFLPESGEWAIFWGSRGKPCCNIGWCGSYSICDTTKTPICGCLQGFEPRNPANWELRDYSDGCERRVALDCRKGTDTFLAVYGGEAARVLKLFG